MKTNAELVREFNTTFEVKMSDTPVLPGLNDRVRDHFHLVGLHVHMLAKEMHTLCAAYDNSPIAMRAHLMLEELSEVFKAMAEGDLVQVLHEMVDKYVVDQGTLQVLGLEQLFDAGLRLVHEANMSKLENGKPVKNPVGRIQKGRFFKKANLSVLFQPEAKQQEPPNHPSYNGPPPLPPNEGVKVEYSEAMLRSCKACTERYSSAAGRLCYQNNAGCCPSNPVVT